ncbi:major capsid protein [uncultured Alistipes sp.]|uniref:major capsid protein n=1 Tax=uncultured Alistipes sp. TaxID=538949 RepID=UPI0026252362|nr:major capsid protein [uncultured Alistipes sp.]
MALMFLSRRKNRRSNVNLSHVKVTDLSVGTVTPIAMLDVTAGDIFNFCPSSFVQAMAMKAPLVNGYKLCLEYFFAPNRLYNSSLLLDEDGVTQDPSKIVFPTLKPDLPPDSSFDFSLGPKDYQLFIPTEVEEALRPTFQALAMVMVQPNSLADYLGFPVGWFFTEENAKSVPTTISLETDENDDCYFNITKVVAYLDIIYNFYVNQQCDVIPTAGYVTTENVDVSTPGLGLPRKQVILLLDDLRNVLLRLKRSENPSQAVADWIATKGNSYSSLLSWKWLCSPCSLFQRSLPPYYLEQWLKTSFVDGTEGVVKVDVSAGDNPSVSFSDVRRASHIQRYLELAMAGGSRYSDYVEAQFDVRRVKNVTCPIFLGSDRRLLGSNIIYQTTGFDSSDSPLGSFAGQMAGGDRFKKRRFTFGEDGTFFIMATLMPDTIYYRGLDPSLRRLRLDDFYVPAKDDVGFQPLRVESLDAYPKAWQIDYKEGPAEGYMIRVGRSGSLDEADPKAVLGFVPAWSEINQAVSRAHGAMIGDLKYWLLAREYGSSPFPPLLQQGIDVNLEDYTNYAENRIGYFSSYTEALRIYFDSMRYLDTNHYLPYVCNYLYNSVFADTSPDAHNFVLTLSMDITVNRQKSKANIPTTL